MTRAARDAMMIQMTQIDNLTAIMNGETIDGVKLGDPGVDAEWARETRDAIAGMIAGD